MTAYRSPEGWVALAEFASAAGVTEATLRAYLSRDQMPQPGIRVGNIKLWRWETAVAFANREKRQAPQRRPGCRVPRYRLIFEEGTDAWDFMSCVGGVPGNVTSLRCHGNQATFEVDILDRLRGLPEEVDGHVDRYNRCWFGGTPHPVIFL